jgi:ABC-type transport system involved in multi-copper enzyme maturation permease subunit
MAAFVLTRMAVRELWISFRLLALLALPVVAGLVALLVSSDPDRVQPTLAWGMGVVAALAAGMAAAALAMERQRGTAGWLSMRAVPRASILIAWFLGLATPMLVGIAGGSLLVWLGSGTQPTPPPDAPAYAALAAAAAGAALQALAIGLLFGSFLPSMVAALVAVLGSGVLLGAGLLIVTEPPLIPTAGLGLLAQAIDLLRPMADGLQALGLGLTLTGLLLGASLLIFDRVDL